MSTYPSPESLPNHIELLRHLPQRRAFLLEGFEPSSVGRPADLPPHLVLGPLAESSFRGNRRGWSASYRGAEAGTELKVRYRNDDDSYQLSEKWCGVAGTNVIATGRLPLGRVLGQFLCARFPTAWDDAAQRRFETEFHLRYLPHDPADGLVCGIPDGPFVCLRIPVAIPELRRIRTLLARTVASDALAYPVIAEAWLAQQSLALRADPCPSWALDPARLHEHTVADGMLQMTPVFTERAADGAKFYRTERLGYLMTVTVPFAGLATLVARLAGPSGLIRRSAEQAPRPGMRPWIAPILASRAGRPTHFDSDGEPVQSAWCIDSEVLVGSAPPTPDPEIEARLRQTETAFPLRCTAASRLIRLGPHRDLVQAAASPPPAPPSNADAATFAGPVAGPVAGKGHDVAPALRELLQLPSIADRIDAVAEDLRRRRKQRRFVLDYPYELAEVLGEQPECWEVYGRAYHPTRLDDYTDEFPARQLIGYLWTVVSADRYAELEAEAEDIDGGRRKVDLSLTAEEVRGLEIAITTKRIEDGAGWLIRACELKARDGTVIGFEAVQGDGGEIFAVTGPHQIHDRGWPEHDDWVVLDGDCAFSARGRAPA